MTARDKGPPPHSGGPIHDYGDRVLSPRGDSVQLCVRITACASTAATTHPTDANGGRDPAALRMTRSRRRFASPATTGLAGDGQYDTLA